MTQSLPSSKSIERREQIVVLGVSLYCLGVFLPGIQALERIGLVSAFLITCFGGRWRNTLRYAKHPIYLVLALLVCWLGLSTAWSVAPAITAKAWWSIFKDFFLFSIPMFYLLSGEARRRWLALALALCGVVFIVLNGFQYISEFLTNPQLLHDIKAHRRWGHPLIFFLPFAVMQAGSAKGRVAAFWYALIAVEALMIFATGARGAWLALFVEFLLWGFLGVHRRQAVFLLIAGLIAATVSYAILPSSLFKDRISQGADTSLRTTGTWGPAMEMMSDQPWLGYGFGKQIFNKEFNRRAPDEQQWTIKKSKGPHSIYLEVGFAGGYTGLAIICLLSLATFAFGCRTALTSTLDFDKAFALAAAASYSGFYITRGLFESVHWGPMIILLSIVTYFSARKPPLA